MTGPRFEIRSATADEQPRAIASVVAAFVADPLARFALPSPHEYLRAMPDAIRMFAGRSFENRSAFVSEDLTGAALWLPPGVEPDGEALEKLFREKVPADRLDDLLGTFEKMGQSHPEEPCWYLPMIGVDPLVQGTGRGSALMRHVVERFDADGVLAYLESSNPRNIPLYERHGFEVMGEIRVGAAPLVTPMLRHPRKPGGKE